VVDDLEPDSVRHSRCYFLNAVKDICRFLLITAFGIMFSKRYISKSIALWAQANRLLR
jgi:hypothetical protein